MQLGAAHGLRVAMWIEAPAPNSAIAQYRLTSEDDGAGIDWALQGDKSAWSFQNSFQRPSCTTLDPDLGYLSPEAKTMHNGSGSRRLIKGANGDPQ